MRHAFASVALATALGLGSMGVAFAAEAPDVVRLGGANRYETMAAVVDASFTSAASSWAVVATGESFPDALAASALAGVRHAPVVLTPGGSLSDAARSELERLKTTDVYLMGGPNVVGEGVRSALEGMGISCARVAGSDRTDTSLKTLAEVRAAGSTSNTIIVASGASYADALSISPWAWASSSPIVLADGDGYLTREAIDAIRGDAYASRILIVGGSASVSDVIPAQLGDGFSYVRLAGADRYETSSDVAAWETEPEQGFTWASPVLATGRNYPDALAGSALCGQARVPLLLADAATDLTVRDLLVHDDELVQCVVLGGTRTLDLPFDDLFAVDEIVDGLIANHTSGGEDALREAFDYIISHYEYIDGSCYPGNDWVPWSLDYVQEMERNGGGNCYRLASLVTWTARALGYDAKAVDGNVPIGGGNFSAHGWTEIRMGDDRYVVDPDLQMFIPDRDFFMVTYDEAPLQYYHLDYSPY